MRPRRVLRVLLATATLLGSAALGTLPAAGSATAEPVDSAVTVAGEGEFAGLRVTVSQTRNLINQSVTVSWTGGAPTVPASDFGAGYLQIMQCWGDSADGPDRTQCQYGGSDTQSSPGAGDFVRTRHVEANLVDPNEPLKPPRPIDDVFVPFWAAGRDRPTGAAPSDRNDFFDAQVTNEVPLARTHGDGTGQEFFEVQTVREASGLGCGEPVTTGGGTVPRPCWLVIAPRGTTEVDGSTRTGIGIDRLSSSPLSQSNWARRLVVKLEFLPVGEACPIGSAERRVIGHELAADAVTSWQPALCAGGGTAFGYTQLPDDVTRAKVLDGSTPGLALVTDPIPPDQAPPGRALVYAPVALSGLAIAFNVEHQPGQSASPDDLKLDGQRFTSMKLTPRLVAKLLTESYRGAVVGRSDALKDNPLALTVDPEFLDLNPEYRDFATYNRPPDALVQLNSADVTSLLWTWVKADPDASAFLAGTPDPSGMVVNPLNKGLALPVATFPRNDQSCVDSIIGEGVTGRICTLDAHPFTQDMHDAGRSAARGDTQARTTVLGPAGDPVPKKVERQDPGHRAVLAVVDAATATRYGLPTAALRNAAGQFVSPTPAGLLAGETAMKPSGVPGVLASDPTTTDPAAYPLTALSYAVTSPSTLDAAAGKDYATFLRYAAGTGQQSGLAPGLLPFGLVPLPDPLRTQTTAAATTVEAQAGKTPGGSLAPPPGGGGAVPDREAGTGVGGAAVSTDGGGAVAGPGGTSVGSVGGLGEPPAVAAQGAPAVGSLPGEAQQLVSEVRRTPSVPAPAVHALIVTILLGGLAAMSAPVLRRIDTARRGKSGEEVTPTGP